MERLLSDTRFQQAATKGALGLLHNVIIVKLVITVVLLIGASVVAALYNNTKPGDLSGKHKIKYISSLWLGENSGLFGTLVILWLPTILFYSVLMLVGSTTQVAGIAAAGVLTAVYLSFSIALIVITATMTGLVQRATTEDRIDKLTYISQIFVGTHSGLLGNLFLLWAPLLFILLLAGPLQKLAPFKGDIVVAASDLADRVRGGAQDLADDLSGQFTPLRAGAKRYI